MIPLYAFVQGDTLGILVLAREDEKIAELCQRVQRSTQIRVAPRVQLALRYGGRLLDPGLRVSQTQLQPLDRIDIVEPV